LLLAPSGRKAVLEELDDEIYGYPEGYGEEDHENLEPCWPVAEAFHESI